MAEDVNVSVIKKTQDSLGKYIKKPPLQEKHLKRPPFRFLHDIISNVIKSTQLLKGLYTPEELNSENVKDKESKIKFLQKAIDATMFITGDQLSVKPSKIVAGHEADKTNQFLQCVAKAIKSKVDSSNAVQKVLNGEKPKKVSKKSPIKHHEDESPSKEIIDNNIPSNINENEENIKLQSESPKKSVKSNSDSNVKSPKISLKSSKEDRRSSIKENDKNKDKLDLESPKKSVKGEKEERRRSIKVSDKNRDKSSSRKVSDKEKSKDRNRRKEEKTKDASKEKSSKSTRKTTKEHHSSRSKKPGSKKVKNDTSPEKNQILTSEIEEKKENVDIDNNQLDTSVKDSNALDGDEVLNERNSMKSASSKLERLVTPRPPSAKGPRKRTGQSAVDGSPKGSLKDTNEVSSSVARKDVSDPKPPPPTAASVRSARPSSRYTRSARPSSARPAPPKIRQREIIDEPQARPESVKPPSNIILQDDEDNEDEAFLIEENPKDNSDLVEDAPQDFKSAEPISEDQVQGRLVKQLLETKKDLEGGSQREANASNDNVEKQVINSTQRKKEREMVAKDVEKLRNAIQKLTRSANPLGKLMDYLQEDFDSMQKEWKVWHDEYITNTQALKQEEILTQSSLEPLKTQLTEVDSSINDQEEKIHNLKNKILFNEEKLLKIFSSINYSSK